MAAPHAILERARVPGDGLFLLQRQPSRLRTPPRIDSPIPMDPEEEEEEAAESEFERNTRGLLDEIFADAPPHLARAGPSISRRDAVQSLSDDDDALINEPVQSRSVSNASIDSDFSMSLELRPASSDEEADDPTPPASSSDAPSQGSEVGEILWDSQPILDHDWGSMDPAPFVPPILPPLETKEQIEARERAEREARHAKMVAIAEQHAAVARQQQITVLRAEEEKAAGIERADPANPAVVTGKIWNISPELARRFLATNKSNQLSHSDRFFFMTPRVYTRNFQFHPLKKYAWSIKLDGNRALWDGFRGVLQSKSRRVTIKAEGFWAEKMPKNCYLDGELVVPAPNRVNGTATEFASLLHEVSPLWVVHPGTQQSKAYKIWDKLQFHAFDIVGADLNDKTLQHRLGVLESTLRQFGLTPANPYLKRVYVGFLQTNARIPGTEMREMHQEVASLLAHYARLGAEGIVIKDYESTYEHRTEHPSVGWLKVKHYEDTEARVVGFYEATAFSEKGVRIELPDETKPTQSVPYANSNLIRFDLLKVGDIVHVDYMPVAPRPGAVKLRTPIIRSVIQDGTTWEEVKLRFREKQLEARGRGEAVI